MNATAAPIPFAGSMLGSYRHVCAFFSSLEEEYDTLLPFVRDGLERGERAYHVLPSQYREEHLEQLRGAGIDVAAAQRRRQLEVATPQETYLRGGSFNKDVMLALIQEALETGSTLGFPLTRLIAHAETVLWHPEDWSTVNEWIEYETRLNDVLPRYDDPVICTYDLNLLNGCIAVDILRTHPVAIIGGLLCENPFFVPPQEFLRQLRQRSETPPSHTWDDAGDHV
jgi:MEDS: MEthanogen/methylotroph, DcmR Sensory domain